MDIYAEISTLKGVGPKLTERLNRCGIFIVLDLLLYFPRDYEYVRSEIEFKDIEEEDKLVLASTMISYEKDIKTKTGKLLTAIVFTYKGHKVIAKWFNQPFIKRNFRKSQVYNLVGKFKKVGNTLEVINPIIGCEEVRKNEIIPKYPLKGDLTDKTLSKLINQVLQEVNITENMPNKIIKKYNLTCLDNAIREIHFPSGKNELNLAINRLKFQELFTYSMKLMMLKKKLKTTKGIVFKVHEELWTLKETLPYQLTNAQSRVMREILNDGRSPFPMNRLVQGDVGSGKTIIALIALFNVIKNGYQGALMAPTEILALQHYQEALNLFKEFNIHIEILTGSTSAKEKKRIKELISTKEPILVIGTHALIQEDVEFGKLGLVVTDEQHRFGVEQRKKLISKGIQPDVLVMTATPIPRTLALYVYSDLDISAIDELPPGRKKVDTKFYSDKMKDKAYKFALDQINKGRQVYIVCPLIDENDKLELNSVEKLFSDLSEGIFKGLEIRMLHGKMKPKEKDEIINEFKQNNIKVIISTTVIEVGVNVPNASVMIIENAERFGLSQLHQLRGRVGRGQWESYCILIGNAKSNTTKRRMEIMTESTDGFYISEQDLKLRGSGEMFGLKQSGDIGLKLANLYDDINIFRCAREEVREILSSEDEESQKICLEISRSLEKWSRFICFN